MLGGSVAALLLASAAWAAVTGIASLLGPGATWISLQWSIALFVAGGFPGAAQAVDRALLVGAGGLIQIAILGSLILVFPALRPPDTSKKSIATTRPVALATALRSSLSSVLASVAALVLLLRNGYWAPMTALAVLKPSLHDEFHSVLQRCLGTIVGATIASGCVYLSRDNPVTLMTMTCVLAACAYSLQRVNYFLFSLCLTAFIVFLLSVARPQELDLLIHRVTATLLGCAASLLVDTVLKQFGLDANRQSQAPQAQTAP
nr:FUSC family protein [Robbsia betulipollinis]